MDSDKEGTKYEGRRQYGKSNDLMGRYGEAIRVNTLVGARNEDG